MDARVKLLSDQLDRHIARHEKERRRLRFITSAMRLGAILLGALITILLGVKGYLPKGIYPDIASIAALIASALLTALTAWESFADNSGRWVRRKVLLGTLWDIRDDLKFSEAQPPKLSEELLSELYSRLKSCLREENQEWATRRAKSITAPLTAHIGR